MKKLVFAVAVAAACAASAEMKIGTVDMLKLVRNHDSYERNKTLLQDTEKDYQKKLDKIKEGLDEIQEEFKKKSEQLRQPMLSESAKGKIEKELMDIQSRGLSGQQRLRSEAMRSQQDLQELEGRLLKSTSADLRKKINEFAEKNGYDLIVDGTAAPYAKKSLDVTPEILKAMGVDPEKAVEATDADKDKKKSNEGK